MLRRVVGVAALAVMLVVGTAAPGIAQEVAPGGGATLGSTWPAWPLSMPSPMEPTSGVRQCDGPRLGVPTPPPVKDRHGADDQPSGRSRSCRWQQPLGRTV